MEEEENDGEVTKPTYQCTMCDAKFSSKLLWVEIEFTSRWLQWACVCKNCQELEWKDFKQEYEACHGEPEKVRRAKLLHAINIRFCDAVAVEVGRRVGRVAGQEVFSTTALVERSLFQGDLLYSRFVPRK